jgi:hypothetical protein
LGHLTAISARGYSYSLEVALVEQQNVPCYFSADTSYAVTRTISVVCPPQARKTCFCFGLPAKRLNPKQRYKKYVLAAGKKTDA